MELNIEKIREDGFLKEKYPFVDWSFDEEMSIEEQKALAVEAAKVLQGMMDDRWESVEIKKKIIDPIEKRIARERAQYRQILGINLPFKRKPLHPQFLDRIESEAYRDAFRTSIQFILKIQAKKAKKSTIS